MSSPDQLLETALHTEARRLAIEGGRIDPCSGGYLPEMEAVCTVESVRQVETSGGNIRYVVRDTDGKEYTTFREGIGAKASQMEGERARIEYHTAKRGQYTNIYLDRIEPVPAPIATDHPDTDPEEAAWRTAVDAAPWLLGESDPHEKTSPEKLYKTLRPFKERVAEDIKQSDGE